MRFKVEMTFWKYTSLSALRVVNQRARIPFFPFSLILKIYSALVSYSVKASTIRWSDVFATARRIRLIARVRALAQLIASSKMQRRIMCAANVFSLARAALLHRFSQFRQIYTHVNREQRVSSSAWTSFLARNCLYENNTFFSIGWLVYLYAPPVFLCFLASLFGENNELSNVNW